MIVYVHNPCQSTGKKWKIEWRIKLRNICSYCEWLLFNHLFLIYMRRQRNFTQLHKRLVSRRLFVLFLYPKHFILLFRVKRPNFFCSMITMNLLSIEHGIIKSSIPTIHERIHFATTVVFELIKIPLFHFHPWFYRSMCERMSAMRSKKCQMILGTCRKCSLKRCKIEKITKKSELVSDLET